MHLKSDPVTGIESLGAGLLPKVAQSVVVNEMSPLCPAALRLRPAGTARL